MKSRSLFCLLWLLAVPIQASAMESADCLILPGMTVDVGGTIPGQLSQVKVDVGDRVEKGEIIASLRSDVQEAVLALAKLRAQGTSAIEVARARLNFETKGLKRSKKLKDRGILATASIEEQRTAFQIRKYEFEEAEMQLSMAELELVRAEAELEIRIIRAPIDGIVAERNLDPGEYLRDDGQVLTIVDLDPLRVDVFLPQSEYRKVIPGDQITVLPDLFGKKPRLATVDVIDAVIDAASATFRVRLKLPNPDGEIVSGVRCTAKFN